MQLRRWNIPHLEANVNPTLQSGFFPFERITSMYHKWDFPRSGTTPSFFPAIP